MEDIRYDSNGFSGDVKLLDGKSFLVEISFPTPAVPNAVRFVTESYTLKIKLTKTTLAYWSPVLEALKELLSTTAVKSTVDLGTISLLYNKKKQVELVLGEVSCPLKHLAPGWFKREDEVATFDFFS